MQIIHKWYWLEKIRRQYLKEYYTDFNRCVSDIRLILKLQIEILFYQNTSTVYGR